MARHRSPSRRRFLTGAAGVALASMAGCAGSDGGTGNTDSEADDADDEANETEGETGDADDGSDDADDGSDDADDGSDDADVPAPDLREANVVKVAFEATDEGYAFDVSLHHDDDGEEGYANWWQVERLDGTRLGRRELLHAHSEQPFTRSETVEVPDDVSCVVVRGHDQTHEYGGVAAVVGLDDTAVRRVDQGADPRSFDASDCP